MRACDHAILRGMARPRAFLFVAIASLALGGFLACSSFETANDTTADASSEASSNETPPAEDRATASDARVDAAAALGFGLVFITSQAHSAKFEPAPGGSVLDGRSGADEFCRSLADGSTSTTLAKNRRWIAWLSWTTDGKGDARSRLRFDPAGKLVDAYRLVDGVTEIFPAGYAFSSASDRGGDQPVARIGVDETGVVPPTRTVWTGTLDDGTFAYAGTCGGWNLAAPSPGDYGRLGNSGLLVGWSSSSNDGNGLCMSESHPIYCFEDLSAH